MLLISCNFIDMAENYASTGTGNVLRFCQGVASIKIQNKVLVVLDNDTSGVDAFHRVQALSLPRNLRVTVLPTLDEMTNFRTLGPAGESLEGVNGGAVSIECFLDLRFGPGARPSMRWTNFNPNRGTYQGELVDKAEYVRAFFPNIRQSKYDTTKLSYLWRFLLSRCVETQETV